MKISTRSLVAFVFILLASFSLILGCSGGTTGTGSTGSSDFIGRIALTDGTPVRNLDVTIPETGDGATTDENGNFSFESTFSGQEVNLLLEQSGLAGSISLGVIPDDSIVSVDISVAIEGNTITIIVNELTVTPRDPAAS